LIVYSRHLIPRRGWLFPGLTDANRISEHRIKSMGSGVSRLGQPRPLNGPFAWRGSSINLRSGWNFTLDEIDLACLDTALDNAVSAKMECSSLSKARFPLPGLSGKLDAIRTELEEGSGIAWIRGISLSGYTNQELRLLWYGLCQYLGVPVCQDSEGQLLREIRNEDQDVRVRYDQLTTGDGVFLSSRARTASTDELRFHSDRTDVVGLFCLSKAKSGGETRIVSSVTVHNEMIRQRPDLAEALYHPIYRSRLGEEKGGDKKCYPLPVFGCRNGKFTSHYSRTFIEGAQLLPDVSPMTNEQWEALDLLVELADQNCFETTFEPGDMQFLNNHVIYHARRSFIDDEVKGVHRKLLRIWLCPPGNRALPRDHAVLWGSVAAGSLRGGIAQTY